MRERLVLLSLALAITSLVAQIMYLRGSRLMASEAGHAALFILTFAWLVVTLATISRRSALALSLSAIVALGLPSAMFALTVWSCNHGDCL